MAAKPRDLGDESDIDPPPPFSDGEISSFSRNWSLACDQKLLSGLRAFSGSVVEQTDQINSRINDLVYEGQRRCLKVMNVVNDLQMLPNTQFIENRVYEEPDIEPVVAETDPSQSTRQVLDVMPKITDSLNRGLKFIDRTFPHLTKPPDPLPDDSEDDDQELREQVRATIKINSLSALSLPAIIGSDHFNESFYAVVKKVTPSSPPVPDDYDLVDSTSRVFETVVEGNEVEDRAEYDSDRESRVLQDMLDSDSDEDFKPTPSNDLFNVFNQSPQLPTASTPLEVEDKRHSKPDLFQASDSESDERDMFSKPTVPTPVTTSVPKPISFKEELERKPISFKEELERKLGQKPTSGKADEPSRVESREKPIVTEKEVERKVNGRVEEEKSSFKNKSQSVRSSTLFESDDSEDEDDFDIFKRIAPVKKGNSKKNQGSLTNDFKPSNSEVKQPIRSQEERSEVMLPDTGSEKIPARSESEMKSNHVAVNERGNKLIAGKSSHRGLFSPSSSSEEEEVRRPSFPPSAAQPASSSSFLPHEQSIVSERNSINRSSLDQLQPIAKETPALFHSATVSTSRPISSASSVTTLFHSATVSTSRPISSASSVSVTQSISSGKQKDLSNVKKKPSLFDESSSSDDDDDDLFKPKARLTLGNNKANSSNFKTTSSHNNKASFDLVGKEKHPVTEDNKMGGLISSLFGPNEAHRETATFHVSHNPDRSNSLGGTAANSLGGTAANSLEGTATNSLESSSVGSSSNVTGRQPKRIESLFEDDVGDDPLFVKATLPKQTKTSSLSGKVNSCQQSETEEKKRNISNITAKDVVSSREGNLASVPDSLSEEERKDPTRDELTTNSRSGLKIPSSDPLLNLESSNDTTSTCNEITSPLFEKQQEGEDNEDTKMDQKIAKISNLIGNKKPPPVGGVSMFGPAGGLRPEDLKVPQLRKSKPSPETSSLKPPPSSEDERKVSEKSDKVSKRSDPVVKRQTSESKVTTVHIDASGMPRIDSIVTLGNQAVKTRPKAMGRRPPTRKTMAGTALLCNGEDFESPPDSVESSSKLRKSMKSLSSNTLDELSQRLGKTSLFSDDSDEEDLFKKRTASDCHPKTSQPSSNQKNQKRNSALFDDSTSSESELPASTATELVSPVDHTKDEDTRVEGQKIDTERMEEEVDTVKEGKATNQVVNEQKSIQPLQSMTKATEQRESKGLFDDDSDDDEDLFKSKK